MSHKQNPLIYLHSALRYRINIWRSVPVNFKIGRVSSRSQRGKTRKYGATFTRPLPIPFLLLYTLYYLYIASLNMWLRMDGYPRIILEFVCYRPVLSPRTLINIILDQSYVLQIFIRVELRIQTVSTVTFHTVSCISFIIRWYSLYSHGCSKMRKLA